MRISNAKTVRYLLANGFNQIWLKAHTKFSDLVYSNSGNYKALDVFNLWDGIGLTNDDLYFIQIKTNNWPDESKLIDWCSKHNQKGMAVNVKLIRDDEWKILIKKYE